MNSTKYFKNRIIHKYCSLIREYFLLIQQSETFKMADHSTTSIYTGLTIIHRVFEYILLKVNNIEHAYHHSQKCYYYYLEYIDQLYKSELSHKLNHIDTVMFVFKKTIFDIYNNDTNSTTNIMSLNNENLILTHTDRKQILSSLYHFVNVMFFWKNTTMTFENRNTICEKYLQRFLLKVDSLDMVKSYLEIIQQKITMDYAKYDDLLNELLLKIEKSKKPSKITEYEKEEYFLYKFYVEEDTFKEKVHEGNRELVNWLFV
jgi:hypothetical protein